MSLERIFLGWTQRPLDAAVAYLAQTYGTQHTWDMSEVVVVVPGGRVGRRLQEHLAIAAERHALALSPPLITTVGQLPELLYAPRRPFAHPLVQTLAWAEALRQSPREWLTALTPQLPEAEDTVSWMQLGQVLRRLHRELASDRLNFAQVLEQADRDFEDFREHDRWDALARIQNRYLSLLDDLELWDRQTARLVAIDRHECRFNGQLVLLGTVDLNRTMRRMLDDVSGAVTALVFAPQEKAETFDEHGCLLPEAWCQAALPLKDEHLRVVESIDDQVIAGVEFVAEIANELPADSVTIGVPDESLVPTVQRYFSAHGVTTRFGPGRLVSRSGPLRLLSAVAAWLGSRTYSDFAALVRHPDLAAYLDARAPVIDWLAQLDDYYQRHLPDRWGTWWGSSSSAGCARKITEDVERCLRGFTKRRKPLVDWKTPIAQLFQTLFQDRTLDHDQLTALRATREVMESWDEIPDPLLPRLHAADAIQLLIESLGDQRVPEDHLPDAVEILGWLELPYDDAEGLVVLNVNEGVIPQSLNADMFLPNRLRTLLGLDDNQRRLARDLYSARLIIQSRDHVRFVAGRTTREGDPLIPSRILFADSAETVARRVIRFYENPDATARPTLFAGDPDVILEPPEPGRVGDFDQISVTQFRAYLACPYRFYLQHIAKLRSVDDRLAEMDAPSFGTLLHDVLQRFGDSPEKDSSDPDVIRDVLDAELDALATRRFGDHPLPAVRIQLEQIRARLYAFAEIQAARAAAGWKIEHTEVGDAGMVWQVDGKPIHIVGRVDRVDYHPSTGRYAVFDYKSGEQARRPEQTHMRRDEWIDLQLPLYRHLVVPLGIEGPVDLGFIALPKDIQSTAMLVASWTPEQLAKADDVARDVIRKIRDSKFWPPSEDMVLGGRELGSICLDNVMR